jgi:hypothetical protein
LILKRKKSRALLAFAVIFVFIISLITLDKQLLQGNLDNLLQKMMTYDLGFSNQKNLYDDGELNNYKNWSYKDKLLPAVSALLISSPEIVIRKIVGDDNEKVSERLDIDIDFENYQKILEDRSRAILNNINKNPVTVKGKITYKGKIFKADFRLKGDLFDHWKSKYRMSLRVNIRGKSTIMGFSRFSLQKPLSRQHPYDQTFQSLMRRVGNLSPLHSYAHVYVNGLDWGVMNIEEHISKEFLEKQKVKDSIVLRFGNEDKWFYNRNSENRNDFYKLSDPLLNVKLYQEKKSLTDDHRRKWLSYIVKLRTINDSSLFDVDHHSLALIMATIWNGAHVLHWSNSRYYFNPYTLMLEPITTDVNQYSKLEKIGNIIRQENYIYADLVSKKKFKDDLNDNYGIVKKAAMHIKDDLDYYDSFFPINMEKSGKTIFDNLNFIENNVEDFFLPNPIINQNYTKQETSIKTGQEKYFLDHVHARHYINGDIVVHNLLPEKVLIKDILVGGKSLALKSMEVLDYTSSGYTPKLITTELIGVKDNEIQIVTEFRGDTRKTKVGPTLVKDGLNNPLKDQVTNNDYIVKLSEGEYEVLPGSHVVEKGIVVHGNLTIKPNTVLSFKTNAYLVIKGNLNANGGENRSIKFSAKDNTWSGMYILGDGGESLLSGVEISKASELESGILKLTSGITFYKSAVTINNVQINNSYAEDALNLVNSKFIINELSIFNTYSDALDVDFSTGEINNSRFYNVGGDALDFSGSEVLIRNSNVSMVKDKAVSVGEMSGVRMFDSVLSDVGVGLASKDGSIVKANNVTIRDYKLNAAMSYVKKDFYGIPVLEMSDCEVIGVGKPYSRQIGATMIVDGNNIKEDIVDVGELYRTEIMAK